MFADASRSMLQQSIVSQSLDPSMAQAALVLTVFETFPHAYYTNQRFEEALQQTDTVIRAFRLLSMDVNDERTTVFIPHHAPSVLDGASPQMGGESAVAVSGPVDAAVSKRWAPPIEWPLEWDLEQIHREELRRLCWTACNFAGQSTLFRMANDQPVVSSLHLFKPENVSDSHLSVDSRLLGFLHLSFLQYALYFEAEASMLETEQPKTRKSTISALFNRTNLLWNYFIGSDLTTRQQLNFILEVWREADRIQAAMSRCTGSEGDNMKWQANDLLLHLRMKVTADFRLLPMLFGEDEAERLSQKFSKEWLGAQSVVAKMLTSPAKDGHSYLQIKAYYVWPLVTQLHT